MKRNVIMFDIDGVLADFTGAYRAVQHRLGKQITLSNRWDDYWDEDVWNVIKNANTAFYRNMPALVDRRTFTRIHYLTFEHDVYFVTARGGFEAKFQTEQWLQTQSVSRPTVILSSRKAEMAKAMKADFAIDDKAGNAVAIAYMAPDTKSFLIDTPFNQFDHDVIGSKVVRVATVDEFLDVACAA